MDETAFKNLNESLSISELASGLAEEKALAVSERHAGSWVIGADQTMECPGECGGISYDKPVDLEQARRHLQQLRGKRHTLHSALCVVRDGDVKWSTVDSAHLTMRDFDDLFLDDYLSQSGDAVLTSVGCYRLEGLGSHLFSHIDGDFFTILGLPLLALLEFLREAEILH